MRLKIKRDNFIYNIIFFLTFIYNFVILSKKTFQFNENIAGIFLLVCLVGIILNYKYINKTYKYIDMLLFLYLLIYLLIRDKINYHIIFIYILIHLDRYKNKKIYAINAYKYIGLISLVIQAYFFRFEGRIVNSMIDPNYSGYVYFLLYIFLDKIQSKFKILILLLGFLTLSRNFLLAYLLYQILKLELLKRLLLKLKLNNFIKIFLIGSLGMILVGELYLYYFKKIYTGIYYLNSWERMFKFIDYSNYYRFLANHKMLKILTTNKCLFGVDIEWYIKNIFMNSPHNLYGVLILNYGIIFMVILMIVANKYLRVNKENLNIVMSLMIYYLFLGYGILGFQLLMTYFILELGE